MKERKDGKSMGRITSEDPKPKRQSVKALISLNQIAYVYSIAWLGEDPKLSCDTKGH